MTIDLKYMESVIQAARDGKLAITRQVGTEAYERHVRHAVDKAVAQERTELRELLDRYVRGELAVWDVFAALDARDKEGR